MSRFKLYRSESVSGTKDWAIMAQSDQLQIRHGKTGTTLKLTEVPLSQCVSNSPQLEMKKRIQLKLNDSSSSYNFVDNVIIETNGKLSEFTNSKLKEIIYWSLEIEPLDAKEVINQIKDAAKDLKNYYTDILVVVSDDVIRINDYQLSLKPSGSDSIDFDTGRGSGFFGIEMGSYVALWFIYLANKLGSKLSLSADNQDKKSSSYLEPIGYFIEDDVNRFTKFANDFDFLSAENKIFSRFHSNTQELDWL